MGRTIGLMSATLAIGLAGPVLAEDTATVEGVFEPPVRLQSESGEIKLGGHGHAGPHVADLDADGTPDLIVGDIFGNVYYFKGLGHGSAARYADPVPVRMDDGEALVFKNW